MGNRISISFKNKNKIPPFNLEGDESITLFSHWNGIELKKSAEKYIKELKKEIKDKKLLPIYPLGRLEPNTVMIDFIRWYTKDMTQITSNFYLGKDKDDGDNRDNGHKTILL